MRPDLAAGPLYAVDGATQSSQSFRVSRDGSLSVQETNSKYYELASRGLLFNATTLTAGIALIVSATTGNHPTIWNPTAAPGSNIQFTKMVISRLSGTDAPGSLMWASTIGAGSTIATAGPIATFTNVAALNAMVGGSPASDTVMRWAPSVCTFTAAPVFWGPIGINLFTVVVTAVIAPTGFLLDYDGTIGVAPGSALSITSIAATTTSLWNVGLTYGVSRA
jgi:hypothetical protein